MTAEGGFARSSRPFSFHDFDKILFPSFPLVEAVLHNITLLFHRGLGGSYRKKVRGLCRVPGEREEEDGGVGGKRYDLQ